MDFAFKLLMPLLLCVHLSYSYKILAVFPFPSKSHYAVIDPLMVRLAERGHQMTVYTHYLKTKAIPNYKEYDISSCFTITQVNTTMESMMDLMSNRFKLLIGMSLILPPSMEMFASCDPLMVLLNSTEQYDLFVTESFHSDSFLMFAQKFRTPFVLFTPNTMSPWLSNQMASPDNPSYIPALFAAFPLGMTFLERVTNTFIYACSIAAYQFLILKKDDEIVKRFLGSAEPLAQTVKNTSLLFINSHSSINSVVPLVPNVIQISGIHIKEAKALTLDIGKFINESEHGVVYFCMGSVLRGESFSEEKRNAFLNAFSKLRQRVLWKWEGDVLPNKSDNIMISKWMPQRDILAHPNVKLFISHGGLLGTSEAVYEGVPIIGIPIFGDQRANIQTIEAKGAGELLDYYDISEEVLLEKIQRLINDPKYKENMEKLSFQYKDRPMSPLDTAVYWTEYVLRHKGAHHLKSAAVYMPWYQYLLLDVIAFMIVILIIVPVVSYFSLKFLLKYMIRIVFGKGTSKNVKVKKTKVN